MAAADSAPALPAAAPASLPQLRSGMPIAELETYLKEYATRDGTKLFAGACLDRLEHFSIDSLYNDCVSAARWQNVTDLLFDADKVTSDIFCRHVREAKQRETVRAQKESARLANAEKKRKLLEEMRAKDEKGPAQEEAAAAAPAPARASAFAALMGGPKAPGAQESFQTTLVIVVPFPKIGRE